MSDCTCHLCGEPVSPEEIIRHMEDEHGLEPERWPDGEIVVIDETLEPEDFGDRE